MHNSPLQHVANGDQGHQVTHYAAQDLHAALATYRQPVDGLNLAPYLRRHADAQVATLEAQLEDEPDPTIVQATGRSLKAVVEGALGNALDTT